jgi:hypothetical protein
VKSLDFFNSLEPKIRAKAFKTSHRLWKDGYLFSLSIDSETYEFYSALSIYKLEVIEGKEEKEEEKEICLSCGKEIPESEYERFNGLCEHCYIEWES